MNRHIIPDDTFSHIESETCWCNPSISDSEGERLYIHNSNYNTTIDINELKLQYEIKGNKSN